MLFPKTTKQIVTIMKMKNNPMQTKERIYSIFCNVYAVLLLMKYPISDNKKQAKAPIPNATSIRYAPNRKIINEKPKDWPNMNIIQTVILNPVDRSNIFNDQIIDMNDEMIIKANAIENTVTTNTFAKSGFKLFMNEWYQISPNKNDNTPIIRKPNPALTNDIVKIDFCFVFICCLVSNDTWPFCVLLNIDISLLLYI